MYGAKVKSINNLRWKKFDQKPQREHKVADLASLPPSKQVLLYHTIPEIKDDRWLTNGKKLSMGEAFPGEIEKIRQVADDGNEDYGI